MEKRRIFKIALIQMKMQIEKAENIARARELIDSAATQGADVIVLPEGFTCNYTKFPNEENTEPIDDFESNEEAVSARMLSDAAKTHGKYIIGGSFPERRSDGHVYNT